jgi:hypothetical protein
MKYRPRIELLESRINPGNLPWPVAPPPGQQRDLLNTYGAFQQNGGLHFHEGIDIIAVAGAPVTAIEDGTVVAVKSDPATPSNSYIVVKSTGHGWNYVHVDPGQTNKPNLNNPVTLVGRPWQVNDQVVAGDQLGVVANFVGAPFPNHVHLDYTDGTPDPAYSPLERPVDDPLKFLSATNDITAPTIVDIHFRPSSADTNGTITQNPALSSNQQMVAEAEPTNHPYFLDTTVSGGSGPEDLIGKLASTTDGSTPNPNVGNGSAWIDIIGGAYDRLFPGGNLLGVKSVWFRITSPTWTDANQQNHKVDTNWILADNFSGEFASPSGTMVLNQFIRSPQTYETLRNIDVVRAAYENDWYSNSAENFVAGQNATYWYTVTNNDGNGVIYPGVRPYFWDSNVAAGHAWNDLNAPAATSNATSAFRDDIYNVTVAAYDAAGNFNSKTVLAILENWQRTISTDAAVYTTNDSPDVNAGSGFSANQKIHIYVRPGQLAEGTLLSPLYWEADITTDANGNIGQQQAALLPKLSPGQYWVIADYNGDGAYNAALDPAFQITVNKAQTSTNLTSNINPSSWNQPLTLTASVTSNGSSIPTGTVIFMDGVSVLGTSALSSGQATLNISTLSVGTHAITTVYSGDGNFFGSTSATLSQTVNLASTSTYVTSNHNPALDGQAITFTATVTSTFSNTPTGTVSFDDGSNVLGTGTVSVVNGSYQASVTSTLAVGSHSITAVYSGDGNNASSTSLTLTQSVLLDPSMTVETSSQNPDPYGSPVTFTATVTAPNNPGNLTPTGTVQFWEVDPNTGANIALLSTATLDANGHATFTTSSLSRGTHRIKALYLGDSNFASSFATFDEMIV